MSFDSRRLVTVLFGGYGWGDHLFDTWEYDGSSWWEVSTYHPAGRRWHQMAFREDIQATFMYGGEIRSGWSEFPVSETWIYHYSSSVPDEICTNGIDDDGDGAIDCADPDCDQKPCDVGKICVGTVCQ